MEKSGGVGPRLSGSGVTLGGLARSAPTGLPWPGWQGLQEQLGRLPGCEGLRLEVLLGWPPPPPPSPAFSGLLIHTSGAGRVGLFLLLFSVAHVAQALFSIVMFSIVLPAQRVAQPSVNLQD